MTHIVKKHFEVLDGLRGMAALAVVVFHFMEVIVPDYSRNFIGHGFLAVDFFFCLSGFVIAYAYDGRIGSLGLGEFFGSRLIRLHPLVVIGSVLGLLGLFIQSVAGPGIGGAVSGGVVSGGVVSGGVVSGGAAQPIDGVRIAEVFLCSILMIPFPVMASRFYNNFSLNAPAWSLFWEYVASLFYALFLHRLGRRYLMMLVVPAGAGIVWVIYKEGSLLGGWSGGTFWDGLVRVAYSFLAGMFVYRSKWIVVNRLGFPALSGLLLGAFVFPYSSWNLLWESLIVLLYFPLIIALGAGTAPAPRVRKFCVFSGKISYPLYMTHYWLIWIFADYLGLHRPAGVRLFMIVLGVLVLQVILAYVVMVVFDGPVRRALSRRTRVVRG